LRLGGFGGGLALCGALWAAGAGGEPVIVDPAPDDPAVDWDLRVEPVDLELLPGSPPLENPSALVFFGPRPNEEFLVLEEDTGRVRHFVQRKEQAVALDLEVGERGLVGIALHPNFNPTPTPVTDPPTVRPPSQDWVYLSYHTGAELRVERYFWNGTSLTLSPDPMVDYGPFEPFVLFELPVVSEIAVGGTITAGFDGLDAGFAPRLYIAIGSLERDRTLQNNETVLPTALFDDTSVILRLDENGKTPEGNPFDRDDDQADPEDRYYAYGVRNPRGLVLDPFFPTLWFTDQSDAGKPDEIGLAAAGTNGGYSDYQGLVTTLLPNTDPLYPLVDLAVDADDELLSTYLNPAFSFEDKGVEPTGLAFGGREVGPLHSGSLFVGGKDGRLFRYLANGSRGTFSLGCPDATDMSPRCKDLTDNVAATDDDLSLILVGQGFGAISDLETGLDGSIYVLSRDGAIHQVFRDALRDLAVSRAKVPRRISLSSGQPVTKRIQVTLENRGEVAEQIRSAELPSLLGLSLSMPPAAECVPHIPKVIVPWFASPPYAEIIGLKPKGKLSLSIDVTWECESPQGSFDFHFDLFGRAIGIIKDEDPDNDLCPRPPDEDAGDKGCGSQGAEGLTLQTDLIPK